MSLLKNLPSDEREHVSENGNFKDDASFIITPPQMESATGIAFTKYVRAFGRPYEFYHEKIAMFL